MSQSARAVVERFERSVGADDRRDAGVHYTPPALARLLIEESLDVLGRVPDAVCDPACGAGSFLLAAADALHDRGIPAAEVVEHRLHGAELDPAGAAAARAALVAWAVDHGVADPNPRPVVVGESLLRPVEQWPGRPAYGFDLVVGNPPFLGQLSRRTSRSAGQRDLVASRFALSAGYADTAALFLLAGLDLCAPGGVVTMVQPQSFLSARDTTPIRDALSERGALVSMWGSDEILFDAAVRVCAPVLRRRAAPGSGSAGGQPSTVRVRWGLEPGVPPIQVPGPDGTSWGPLLAAAHGVPHVVSDAEAPTLATVARATAGFRDEYYALRDAMQDLPGSIGAHAWPRLVTVGMVEPGWSSWGEQPRRFGGAMRTAPRLDVAALEASSPRVARWAAARRVPKVLVATQTRIVEAVADPLGDCVPVTPLISVEPTTGAVDPWWITAALLAPPVAATAVARHFGSGLSPATLRWSARGVMDVVLPQDRGAWAEGAEICRELAVADGAGRERCLRRLGRAMCSAHGLDGSPVVLDWWLERVLK